MARASRAVGPLRAGRRRVPAAALDPQHDDMMPFSVTPTTPTGGSMPGKALVRDRAALVDDEPRPDPAAAELVDGLEGRRTEDLLVAPEGQPHVLGRA